MSKRNDISTPEGYFGDLQLRLSEIPDRVAGTPEKVTPLRRLAPYATIAASFLVAVLVGNAVLRGTVPATEDDGWAYVSYLADAMDPDGAVLVDGTAWGGEEDGLSREDIVNYLLADGISVELINYVHNEEGF